MSSALKVLTTRLVLPPDQQLTSNQIANFLLAPIQYILGQTVVKKEGDQFVKTPVPPSLVKTALLIVSLATSTRYFGHWPGLGFVAAVALGTAARVYSMSHSPELREGLFGKTTSTTPSQPLQQQPSSPSCPSENTPLPTEDSKDPVTVPKIDLEPSPPPHPSNSSVVQDTIPSPPPQPVEPPPTAPTNPYQTLIDTIDRLFPKEKRRVFQNLKNRQQKHPLLIKTRRKS